ncbi:hypothetical protein PF007_g27015 [Phytophthora fragariae]|uniref:Uncharacterized protein n=1 Tax=Phytophthora fragariae TaxID=53985 RepID=A0A6A3Q883_9STRA|nr:hypothetical protein PF007_g27015 [Phytophthora fragariae]
MRSPQVEQNNVSLKLSNAHTALTWKPFSASRVAVSGRWSLPVGTVPSSRAVSSRSRRVCRKKAMVSAVTKSTLTSSASTLTQM